MSITAARQIAEGSAEALIGAIEALQGRVAARLAALTSRLRTGVDGRILPSAENIAIVEAIIAEAKASMIDEPFVQALAAYITSFDTITEEVFDEFDEDLEEDGIRAMERATKGQMAEALVNPDTYTSSLWRPVANTLLLGVVSEAALDALAGDVSEQITAGKGAIVEAVEADVATAPSVLQRTVTQGVADQIGAEFFLYQGRPIRTTRGFCAEREGKVWHREEIADWGRRAAAGEDLDGNGNPGWAGMVEGTNETTIFLFLGGWYGGRQSCRHMLIPVPLRDVPREDLDRMRDKGLVD
jgi:hypothetical protein